MKVFPLELGISPPTVGLLALSLSYAFWTITYDTTYASQDIKDDTQPGIKSVAIRHKNHIKPFLCHVTDPNRVSGPDGSNDRCWTSLLHWRRCHNDAASPDGHGSGCWKPVVVLVVVQIRGTACGRKRVPELVRRVSEEVVAVRTCDHLWVFCIVFIARLIFSEYALYS